MRLRADDLPEGEEPSYKMVETPPKKTAMPAPSRKKPSRAPAGRRARHHPAQPAPVSARDQEPGARPAAAAPAAAAPAPSPVAAALAQPGVMARLVGWVKSLFTTEVPAPAPAPEPVKAGRRQPAPRRQWPAPRP